MNTKRFKKNDSYEYMFSQIASESRDEDIVMIRKIQLRNDLIREISYTAILALVAAPIVALALAGAPLSFIAVVSAFLLIGILSALSTLKPASASVSKYNSVEAIDKVEAVEIEQPHYPNWDEFCEEYDRGVAQKADAPQHSSPSHFSSWYFFPPKENENEVGFDSDDDFFECEQSQHKEVDADGLTQRLATAKEQSDYAINFFKPIDADGLTQRLAAAKELCNQNRLSI